MIFSRPLILEFASRFLSNSQAAMTQGLSWGTHVAAKTWDADFRYPAIQASIPQIREGHLDDPFSFDGSFCIPVAKRPAVGWTPGKIMLIVLVLGFALLGAGAFLASQAERNPQSSLMLGIAAAVCSLSGMASFFVPLKFDRYVISWLIGNRGRELIERAGMAQIMSAEISNADRSSMKLSIDGDDHVLIYLDESRRRVLIEGTAARYQIREEDVEQVLPFEFMNYVGVELTCRIGETARLHIAVARVSLMLEFIRQIPILFFLRNRIPNRLFNRFSEVLSHPPDPRP